MALRDVLRAAAWLAVAGVANLAFLILAGNQGRWWPAAEGEYFLTGSLGQWWSSSVIFLAPVQFVVGYLAGRAGRLRWWATLLACIAVYLALVLVEAAYEPSSHNLLPFELGFWAVSCSPVALGTLLAQLQARRARRLPGG